jgi:hypothetical protein
MQFDKLPGDLLNKGLNTVQLWREGDVVLPGPVDIDRILLYHRPRPAYRDDNQGNDGE